MAALDGTLALDAPCCLDLFFASLRFCASCYALACANDILRLFAQASIFQPTVIRLDGILLHSSTYIFPRFITQLLSFALILLLN